jgi:hypothetical protein
LKGAVNVNVRGGVDEMLTKVGIVEPSVSELCAFEFEMVIEKLKRHKSLGILQMPVEFIKQEVKKCSHTLKIIHSVSNKENLQEERKESFIVLFIRMAIQQTVVIIQTYHFFQLFSKFHPTNCCQC